MSLNTTPTVLASIDNTVGWHGVFEYRLRSETSTKAVYDLWDLTSNPNNWANSNSDGSIKVVFSTGTWADNGSANPSSVVENSDGTISLFNTSNLLRYKFTKPTASTASWLSSGGGTSTEEVLVEDARMVYYSGITGWRFEQRGFAAGSYQLIGGTVSESWTVSSGSNNLQHHISQIPAGGTYLLYSGSTVVASLTTTSKKVFCNFW